MEFNNWKVVKESVYEPPYSNDNHLVVWDKDKNIPLSLFLYSGEYLDTVDNERKPLPILMIAGYFIGNNYITVVPNVHGAYCGF